MIENLSGIRETVNFKANTGIRLYANAAHENYPDHWHTPLEIIMPLDNAYPVTCGNVSYLLQEGEILLIAPGAVHSCKAAVGKRLIFQADFTLLHHIRELGAVLSLTAPALYITAGNCPLIHDKIRLLLTEIAEEYFEGEPLSEAAVYAKLIQIFILIGRNYSYSAETAPNQNAGSGLQKYAERLLFICDHINKHFSEELTLDDIAGLSGFSKYHFSRLFKQFTNLSFYKYLNTQRIENAEKMLIDRSLTVTEVAMRCGFGSLSAFNRMFKIIKGCTPSEYKGMYHS